jgi:ubiquinol-cytochrome c reductase iron-sulfur subunit
MTAADSGAHDKLAHRAIGLAFTAAAAAAILFSVVYWWNDNTQWEGLTLGLSFVLLAFGLVLWSKRLPEGPFEEEYPDLRSGAREEAQVLATVDRGFVGRRRFLLGAMGLAGASILAGAVSAVRSLGPGPFSLAHTPWRGGRRLVTSEGTPVHIADVPLDTFVVVFPEGFGNSPVTPAVLIRVPPRLNLPLPGRTNWAPDGFLCYSRVCTHAGCSVGQYNASTYELQCPCHQSVFNILRGAAPVFGPATDALPQLPLAIESDGTLRSTGDFSGPVGPPFWRRS